MGKRCDLDSLFIKTRSSWSTVYLSSPLLQEMWLMAWLKPMRRPLLWKPGSEENLWLNVCDLMEPGSHEWRGSLEDPEQTCALLGNHSPLPSPTIGQKPPSSRDCSFLKQMFTRRTARCKRIPTFILCSGYISEQMNTMQRGCTWNRQV